MSLKPPSVPNIHIRKGPFYLAGFEQADAPTVVGWVRNEAELFRLAPKTVPPLTPAKVIAWPGADGSALLLRRDDVDEPLGYLELNPMPGEPDHFWMGHCIVPPERRDRHLGRLMVSLMLREAFVNRAARRVSLVVFPENLSAIRCYRRAGFVSAGEQVKFFATSGRQHRMLRMTIERDRHALPGRAESNR